jgi:hypothetical protein
MNVKCVGLIALVLSFCGVSAAHAQKPAPPSEGIPMAPTLPSEMAPSPTPTPGSPVPSPAPTPTGQLSDWIMGTKPECCGPFGEKTIGYEIYLRNGLSLPFGGGALAKSLDPGWKVQGGARVLFINGADDAAWTVDLGVSNVFNHADGKHIATLHDTWVPNPAFNPQFPVSMFNPATIFVPNVDVTMISFNRTAANLALGREWYLWNAADSHNIMWRAGFDAGMQYGSEKLRLLEQPLGTPLRHRTHVFGGTVLSLHTDVEIPRGAVIYQAGFRAEWDYTFSEILQDGNNGNVFDVNLMLTLGVRF